MIETKKGTRAGFHRRSGTPDSYTVVTAVRGTWSEPVDVEQQDVEEEAA